MRARCLMGLLVAVVCGAVTAFAEDAPKKIGSVEGFTEYQLANGLKFVVFVEPSKPKLTVNMTILVGSKHEGYGEAGMAHLLEHMLFKPTKKHPQPDRDLQERGANYNGTTWVDRKGSESPISLDDVLIIAPYNAQVFELQDRIPGGRIGTVDKFQGQEAPIVIYSMTTSSYLDAPRGMEFLYSSNRLNVATSRARAICVLVGSPAIFEAECRTPRQMQLANAFCRYLEMADTI